jgi:hypothetical protein
VEFLFRCCDFTLFTVLWICTNPDLDPTFISMRIQIGIRTLFDLGSGIRDGIFGSRIWDKHPGSATLPPTIKLLYLKTEVGTEKETLDKSGKVGTGYVTYRTNKYIYFKQRTSETNK